MGLSVLELSVVELGKETTKFSHLLASVSTVVDLPFIDLLPHVWYAIKHLSQEMVPEEDHSSCTVGINGRNFRTKGFSSLDFPPIIRRVYGPLEVCRSCFGECVHPVE